MTASPLTESLRDQYLKIYAALAEPLRLDILSLFENDECACTHLENQLPVSKSTISYHIKILNDAGLLTVRKEGRYYHYNLRRDVFEYFVPKFLERLPPLAKKAA